MSILSIFKRKKGRVVSTTTEPEILAKTATENVNGFLRSNSLKEDKLPVPTTKPCDRHFNTSFDKTVEYYIPDELQSFVAGFDNDITNYVNGCSLDEYNEGYFKSRVNDVINMALSKIELQRQHHMTVIDNINFFNEVEKERLKSEIEYLEEELHDLEELLSKYTEDPITETEG